MRGLYAIADLTTLEARGVDPVAFSRAVIEGGARLLQVRAKHQEAGRVLGVLRALRPICAERGVTLVANDRADLALIAGCGAVHLGQHDPDPAEVRALAEAAKISLAIGVSTHDEAQAAVAVRAPVDYVAVGPVLGTTTKENADPVLGVARARAIAAQIKAARDVPVVAIGGIDARVAAELAGAFDAVAVISALVPGRDEPVSRATERARAIAEVLS